MWVEDIEYQLINLSKAFRIYIDAEEDIDEEDKEYIFVKAAFFSGEKVYVHPIEMCKTSEIADQYLKDLKTKLQKNQ